MIYGQFAWCDFLLSTTLRFFCFFSVNIFGFALANCLRRIPLSLGYVSLESTSGNLAVLARVWNGMAGICWCQTARSAVVISVKTVLSLTMEMNAVQAFHTYHLAHNSAATVRSEMLRAMTGLRHPVFFIYLFIIIIYFLFAYSFVRSFVCSFLFVCLFVNK